MPLLFVLHDIRCAIITSSLSNSDLGYNFIKSALVIILELLLSIKIIIIILEWFLSGKKFVIY